MGTIAAMIVGAFLATLILAVARVFTPPPSLRERIEHLYSQSQEKSSDISGKQEKKKGIEEVLNRKLEGSGVRIKLNELFMVSFTISAVSLILFWSLTGNFVFGFLISLVAFLIVPYYLIETRRKQRLQKIDEQLAEALSIMASGLRSGQSVQQTLLVMEREMEPPIKEELARINGELRIGEPFDRVMTNFKDRIPSQDVEMFVSAVLISRQLGGDLAEILENISSTIQERISLKREVLAKTAMARMSSLILSLSPGVMFVALYVLNQSYIEKLIYHPSGPSLLFLAFVLNIVGARVSARLVKMEDLEATKKR